MTRNTQEQYIKEFEEEFGSMFKLALVPNVGQYALDRNYYEKMFMTYLAGRKRGDEEVEEYLTVFLNECGFDNSGCYDIEEVKSHFKRWIETQKEIAVEKLEKEIAQLKAENDLYVNRIKDLGSEIKTLRHYFSEHEKLITTLKEELKLERECVDNYIESSDFMFEWDSEGRKMQFDVWQQIFLGGLRAKDIKAQRKVL